MSDDPKLLSFWSEARPWAYGNPCWEDAPGNFLPWLQIRPAAAPEGGGEVELLVLLDHQGVQGACRLVTDLGRVPEILSAWSLNPEQALRKYWAREPPTEERKRRLEDQDYPDPDPSLAKSSPLTLDDVI